MATKISSIYTLITADDKPLKRGLVKARGEAVKGAKRIQTALNKINFKAIGLGAAAMGGVIALAAKKAIDAASDLEEVTSKFGTVFGDQVGIANMWAAELVKSYMMSTREAKKYLSEMQDLLVPMGMNAVAAGKMSNSVVKLAADLGSFNNLRTEDVMRDIQSALVGNFETMKKYGVVLNQAVITQKALDLGLIRNKKELNATTRAQTAYQLIVEGSTFAIGDAARTAGGYANQMKKVRANVEEAAGKIGSGLLPMATKAVAQFNTWVVENDKLLTQDIPGYVGRVAVKMEDLVLGLGKMVKIYDKLPDGITGAAGVGILWRVIFGAGTGGAAAIVSALAFTAQHLARFPEITKEAFARSDIGKLIDAYKELNDWTNKLFFSTDRLVVRKKVPSGQELPKMDAHIIAYEKRGVAVKAASQSVVSAAAAAAAAEKEHEAQIKKVNAAYVATLPTMQMYRDSWQVSDERTATDEQIKSTEDTYKKMGAYRDHWVDDTIDAYGTIDQQVDALNSHMSDGLANFVSQGKLDFKSLADSMIQEIIRIQARAAISGLFSLIGSASSLGGTTSGTTIRGGEGGGYGFDSGGHIGEPVKGFGMQSGKSYEFHPNETVIPDKDLTAASGGSGGDTYNVYNITALDAPSVVELVRRSGAVPILASENLSDNGMLRQAMLENM